MPNARIRILRTEDYEAMLATTRPEGACLIWTGATEGKASGTPYYFGHRVKKALYEHWNGPMPQGHKLTMTCRNPLCVAREHMSAVVGGGGAYHTVIPDTQGELNANNVLTEDEVLDIINLYATTNTSYRKLGLRYGVDQSTIGLIIRGHRDGKGNWLWLHK